MSKNKLRLSFAITAAALLIAEIAIEKNVRDVYMCVAEE